MPAQRKDEIPEYPFAGPFGGIQSEVPPSRIGNFGFDEVQNILFRLSGANPVPEFTPLKGGSPDGTPVMGVFDFFDKNARRVSGVFTQKGLFWYLHGAWLEVTPSPSSGSFLSDTAFGGTNVPVYSAGIAISGNDEDSVVGTLPAFRFFQTSVVGYKLYFSNRIIPIQVWDGENGTYFTADDYSTVEKSAPQGVTYFHVCPSPARYLMELNFHLITGNTKEIPATDTTSCPQPSTSTPLPDTSAPPSAFTQLAPQRVHWSAAGDGADWSSFSAGQVDIFNNLGPITGMTRLFQSGYIFQQWGVTQVVPTGQALAPFQFITMGAYAKGNVFPYSLASFGEQIACYVAKDDIYLFDGTNSTPIGQHPIQGGSRQGARSRIFFDLFNSYQQFPTDPSLVWDQSAVWAVIMTASRGNVYEAYWLFIPWLNKAWVFNFDEQNWTQLFFQPNRLNGPAISQFWAPQEFSTAQGGLFRAVDSMVIADNRAKSVSFMDFSMSGTLPTHGSINPGDGWFIRSGNLDFDDNRHPHTVNWIRMVLTDVGRMQFFIRLHNEVGYSTPVYFITIGEGTGKAITTMIDLQNGITGKYITWELSGMPGQPFQMVEFTPYPVMGGEVMTRCEVVVNPTVVTPPTGVSVTISPASVTLPPGGMQQFNAVVTGTLNQHVNWSASAGGITVDGLFTAPDVTADTVVTVTAVSEADITKKAQVQVAVKLATGVTITILPLTVSINAGETQRFTAIVTGTSVPSVTWSVGAVDQGSINQTTGIYTAPAPIFSPMPVTIIATSDAEPTVSNQITMLVNPAGSVTVRVTPEQATVTSQGTQQFTATVGNAADNSVNWLVTQGTITPMGLFTAPSVTATAFVVVTATSVQDGTKRAQALAIVNPPA